MGFIQKYIVLLLIGSLIICCKNQNKENTKKNIEKKMFKIYFKTSSEDELFVFTNSNFSEILNSEEGIFNVSPNDSVSIPLKEEDQYFFIGQPFRFEYPIIAKSNESYVVEFYKDIAKITKIVNGKLLPIMKLSDEKYGQSINLIPQIEKVKSIKNITLLKAEIDQYLKVSDIYYKDIRDSLLKLNNGRAYKLQELVMIDQYEKLIEIQSQLYKVGYQNVIMSEKYLNSKFLDNRNLIGIFQSFYNSRYRIKPNRNFEIEYNLEFENFNEAINANFKLAVLSDMIYMKYERETISRYIENYEKKYGSSKVLEKFKKDIAYKTKVSENLLLNSIDGKKDSLKNILQTHKGKIIYIDFWASWCKPCIGELPFSKKLHNKYNDIVFLYLALNDEEKKWQKAINKFKLLENSYFISNSISSEFITEYKIKTIPRYMIIDKKGQITYSDAPRPSSKEIDIILNKLR